ncbi:MAG: RNA polymerase sigma factor [Myxococcota bacterium]
MTGPPPKLEAIGDAELVRLARDDSRRAIEVLFRRHASMVHALSYRLLGRPHEAQEVAQESLLTAFKDLSKLREPERFSSWLRAICAQKCRSRIRNLKVRRRLGLLDGPEYDLTHFVSTDPDPAALAELRLLGKAVSRLSAEERATMILVRVEGMTLPEAAETLGRSLATIKRRLARAESRLSTLRRQDDG